jgi:hypothetical protein
MEQLDAVLKEWGFEPDDFDDWREEMGDPQEVAVIYHAEGGAFVKLYATPLPEGYGPANGATMIPARMDDNWLFGVEGLEKWGSGADALRATLEELFEKEAA